MSQPNRLSEGGRIKRAKVINFSYNDKTYPGFEGDTLASAMLANGIDVIGRSFKYSRARGIVAAGAEEPNAIMQLGATEATQVPNVRATQQELYDGLVAKSTNGWPNVDFDMMSTIGKVGAKVMPPGFYYKTFMYPKSLWSTYEKYIRKAAGLGRSPLENDPDRYDHYNQHADILIVGAGPAGLSAALVAARSGARVIIADEQAEFGGSLLHSKTKIDGEETHVWLEKTIAELASYPEVMMLPKACVNGYHDHNFLTIHERVTDHLTDRAAKNTSRQRMHRVRTKWVVLATGAHERPLVYANNDVPGNMLASAVSTYINRYAVVPGKQLVVMTTNDNAYSAAFDWHNAGREVIAIVDTRKEGASAAITAQASALNIKVITGSAVVEAQGTKRVSSVSVSAINDAGDQLVGTLETLTCDTLASSGGWSPALHLSCHTGSRPIWSDEVIGFIPGDTLQQQLIAGSVSGCFDLGGCLIQGAKAGEQAVKNLGFTLEGEVAVAQVQGGDINKPMALFHIPHPKATSRAPKQFVDMQNDVTAAGIELATLEGFESIEHVKRYTAMGFGTDQGKLGNINGMAIAAKSLNKTIPETGTTIFRPNYTPVTFGAIVGRHCGELFDPKRYTAMHQWHLEHGALFEDVGNWKRPWYFPQAGESMQQTLERECLAVRNSAGVLDASTLGKIDIQGPDAREFLARVYTNAWAKLAVGKCRYGLMCGEDGMVFDDGVTACLADNHFVMTTTTGGAARVLEWLEIYQQTEWPELQVYFNSVTDHWSTVTVTGPNARKIIEQVVDDIDVSNDAFKFMDWKAASVKGVPARIFRISFTGELSFEINVQANYGLRIWEAVMAAGEAYNLTPYGTETMHILRAEKGFIIAGQDTDGSVHPYDLGMGWAVSMKKPFSFIGKRGMARADCVKAGRKQLVGIKTTDPKQVIPEGAQAVNDPNQPIPMTMLGHVTSSYYSACLGHSIAMAYIRDGHKRMGETVFYPLANGKCIEAQICSPIFFDPKGEQQNV